MLFYLPRTDLLSRTAAALLFAAVIVSASGRAMASCGDYVTIAGQSVGHGHDPITPMHGGSDRLPCQGPSCSGDRHPGELPLTAPVKISTAAKDIADQLAAGLATADGRHGFHPVTSDGAPVGYSLSIYHPPRLF
jgi:hypothetical protein